MAVGIGSECLVAGISCYLAKRAANRTVLGCRTYENSAGAKLHSRTKSANVAKEAAPEGGPLFPIGSRPIARANVELVLYI